MKDKNHMIISIYAEKASDKTQHLSMTKAEQIGYRRNVPQHNKDHYSKPTANISLNSECLKSFPLRSGKDKGAHSHHYYSTCY